MIFEWILIHSFFLVQIWFWNFPNSLDILSTKYGVSSFNSIWQIVIKILRFDNWEILFEFTSNQKVAWIEICKEGEYQLSEKRCMLAIENSIQSTIDFCNSGTCSNKIFLHKRSISYALMISHVKVVVFLAKKWIQY